MFLDDASGILLAGPMLMPIMAAIGVDPVHFCAILGVNLGMGLITPPTAPILYFAGAVGKASLPSMLGPPQHFLFLCSSAERPVGHTCVRTFMLRGCPS